MTFKEWENKVNALMLRKHGVGIDDIPDMPYYTWWDNDMFVEDAVKEAIDIVNEGGF